MITSLIKKAATFGIGVAMGAVAMIGVYEFGAAEYQVVAEASGTVLVQGDIVTPDPTHPATGGFEIVATEGGGRAIVLNDEFGIVKAPDPHVRVNGVIIARVVNYEGKQSYPIPNIIGDIESVDIWCKLAGVKLGAGIIK